MNIQHPWDLSPSEAIQLQLELAPRVIKEDQFSPIRYIGGTDVGYDAQRQLHIAAIVILDIHTLQIVEIATKQAKTTFPYIPGLLSFREIPALIDALDALKCKPDILVCDGQGIAHPRYLGIASHLGVVCDIATIGCGKSLLVGTYKEPDSNRGSHTALIYKKEIIGSVVRTRDNVRPVYVSIGHRVSLETAREIIFKLTPRYRLPETTRHADRIVKAAIKNTL